MEFYINLLPIKPLFDHILTLQQSRCIEKNCAEKRIYNNVGYCYGLGSK